MKWHLEFGKYEKFLEKRAAKGHRVEVLEQRPELFPDLQPIYAAFWELCPFRPRGGFAASPILLSDIIAWLNLYQVNDPELRQLYFRLISKLDQVMIQWFENKSEREKKEPNANDRGRNR